MRVSPLSVSTAVGERHTFESVGMVASTTPQNVSLKQLTVEHAMAQLNASGELELDGILSHELKISASSRLPDYAGQEITLSSQGNINQLTAKLQAKGPLTADGQLSAQLSTADLPLTLNINWQQLHWPIDADAEAVAFQSQQGELQLKGDLRELQVDGQAELSGASVPVAQIELQALANRSGAHLKHLTIDTLGGKISANASLDLTNSLEVVGNVMLEHINPGVLESAYQGDINGQLAIVLANIQGQWQGELNDLELTGDLRSYPLSAQGNVKFDSAANIEVEQLQLKNGDNTISLAGRLSSDKALDFLLQLDAPELRQSIADLQGNVSGSITLGGTIAAPQLNYDLDGHELAFADIRVQKMQGQGEVIWDDVKPLDMHLEFYQLSGITHQIERAKLQLSGNAQAHQLVLDTTSNNTNLQAKISGQLSEHSWQGQWLEGQVKSNYVALSLREPFAIVANWQDGEYSVAPHCWQQDNSELCIQLAEFKQQQAKWNISLHDLNVLPLLHRLVSGFPAIESSSLLSMTLEGEWLVDQLPQAQIHAELSPADWYFTQQDNKTSQNLSLNLQTFRIDGLFSSQNVKLQAELGGPQIGAMHINLLGQAGDFANQLSRPIDGSIDIKQFNLAPFRILLPGLDKFEGMLAGQAAISGTLELPLFNGNLLLSDGALQGEGLPLVVSGVEQQIQLQGDKATINGRYLLGKGQGNISGELTWQPQLSGHIEIQGDALEFDYQSMLRAQVSPDVEIDFAADSLKVRGELSVPYARFKLRELPPNTISPSKDVILVEQQNQASQTDTYLDLSLTVLVDPSLNNQVKLDAFGLTTDLRGKLHLENNQRGMTANGEMQLVNGRYKAYGQNLVIREGDITFNGPLERPILNIEAIRDPKLTADDVIAGIRVEGATDNPNVAVFSEPVMEQQQSLSYMLTGRGIGESSGESDNTMLTNMLLGFGLGKSENMVSNLGEKLGFRDVNLDTSGQGENTQLAVSGYVAPGVQLRYGVGVFDSVSEVALRYELLPQLYIEAVSGLNNAIDIYYRFSVEGEASNKNNIKTSN